MINASEAVVPNYGTFCLSTENTDMSAVRQRLSEPAVQKLLYYLMMDHITTMKQLDVLKKYVYYGKKGDLVAAPTGFAYDRDAVADDNVLRRLHCVLGIVTEGVELTEHMFNELFLGKKIPVEVWLKELGDPCWYTAVAADTIGSSFDAVLEANIKKLAARYKKQDGTVGFTEDAAQTHKGD